MKCVRGILRACKEITITLLISLQALTLALLVLTGGSAFAADIIGAMMPTPGIPYYEAMHAALVTEWKAQGGGDILLQKPASTAIAWANATRKLATHDAKIIIAYGGTAAAVSAEAKDLPVIYCGAFDPVAAGVVSGGKITGIQAKVPIIGLIKNLKAIATGNKLGIIFSSEEKDTVAIAKEASTAATGSGFEVEMEDIGGKDEIKLPAVNAVLLTTAANAMTAKNLEKIVEQARAGKIVTAALFGGAAEKGIIITLSANPEHQGQEAAKMLAAMSKGGAPPPPVNTPKIEMHINTIEAKTLGLNIPFELLGTAKVIK